MTTTGAKCFSIMVFSLVAGLGSITGQNSSARTVQRHHKIERKWIQIHTRIDCSRKKERGRFCSANGNGCNALMRAAESGDLNNVRMELNRGADVNMRPAGNGPTALMLASASGQLEIVLALLKAGADPNAKAFSFHDGEFSIVMAGLDRCNKDWIGILDAIIAAGGEVNPQGSFSRSPLMYAVEKNDVVLVKALLARNADVNLKSETGITPLMTATISSEPSVEVVKLLLAAGADANARSKDGETALSLLDKYSRDETARGQIARLLKTSP